MIMNSRQEIGGYFELDLPPRQKVMHEQAVWLNTGRNALEYILINLPDVQTLWIPHFTCDVICEPLNRLKISIKRYDIDEQLELLTLPDLSTGEYLLATNYFGIKDAYIQQLYTKYGNKLIIDNAQAWYAACPEGAKALYSPRKFVGLPDGGIAYGTDSSAASALEPDYSYDRCIHLLKRIDYGAGAAYADFKSNSSMLHNLPVCQMSNLTKKMLHHVDFESIRTARWENFCYIHERLKNSNMLNIPQFETFACPMIYPYRTKDTSLKNKLIINKIYVATYWPNILIERDSNTLEYQLANSIIALPIDQRYGIDDMKIITETILL